MEKKYFWLTLSLMKFSSKVYEDDYLQSSIAVCELQYLQYLTFVIQPRYLRIHLLQQLDDHCKSPQSHHWCRYHHRYHLSKLNFWVDFQTNESREKDSPRPTKIKIKIDLLKNYTLISSLLGDQKSGHVRMHREAW